MFVPDKPLELTRLVNRYGCHLQKWQRHREMSYAHGMITYLVSTLWNNTNLLNLLD